MGIVALFQGSGSKDQAVKARRVRKALVDLTDKLEKKAAKIRKKLESENTSPEDRKRLSAKLHVLEAQIKRGHESSLFH